MVADKIFFFLLFKGKGRSDLLRSLKSLAYNMIAVFVLLFRVQTDSLKPNTANVNVNMY